MIYNKILTNLRLIKLTMKIKLFKNKILEWDELEKNFYTIKYNVDTKNRRPSIFKNTKTNPFGKYLTFY